MKDEAYIPVDTYGLNMVNWSLPPSSDTGGWLDGGSAAGGTAALAGGGWATSESFSGAGSARRFNVLMGSILCCFDSGFTVFFTSFGL